MLAIQEGLWSEVPKLGVVTAQIRHVTELANFTAPQINRQTAPHSTRLCGGHTGDCRIRNFGPFFLDAATERPAIPRTATLPACSFAAAPVTPRSAGKLEMETMAAIRKLQKR